MKLRQKIISVASAMACAVSFCAGAMTADAVSYSRGIKYGDYLYYKQVDENNDGTFDYAEISDCANSAKEVIIPNEIDEYPVKSIGDSAFSGCTSLTSIKIPNSITSIGNSAFSGCTSLASIEMPDSVTDIGGGVFYGCSNLSDVKLSNNIESLNTYYGYNYSRYIGVFEGCTSLKSIEIPNSVTSIYSSATAFSGCTSLESINVSENNECYSSVDGVLFNKNKTTLIQYTIGNKNKNYKIPNSVTSIEDYAFSGCTSLASITIPDGVTSIKRSTFSGCTSLESIEIPDSVINIEWNAFFDCTSLESINVSENNRYYSSVDGVLFNKGKTTLIQYTIGNKNKNYKVPDGVTYIKDYAFSGCTSLTSIEIPDSVTSLEYNIFKDCVNLTIYANSNSYAHRYANENDIEFVSLGEAVVTAPAVTTAPEIIKTYPATQNITRYKNEFFYGRYENLYYKQMRTICEHDYGTSVSSYVSEYGNITIYDCDSSATEVVIPERIDGAIVDSIEDYAFSDCTNLISIEIPNSIKSIGYYTFSDCTNLTSIKIPDSVTSIKDYTFRNCTSLKSVSINSSVTSIGERAFWGCDNFVICGKVNTYAQEYAEKHNITFCDIDNPNSDEMIYEEYLFYRKFDEEPDGFYDYVEITDCAVLATKIIVPDEIDNLPVRMIGDKAFYACKNLLSVEIPESVNSIGVSAFEGCSSLESIKLPKSLTTIKSNAFYGCNSLKSIELSENVMAIESSIFSNCTSLEEITILNTECEISSIPKNVVVYGYKNSTAYIYCLKNGISFVALDDSIVTTPAVTTSITTATSTVKTTITTKAILDTTTPRDTTASTSKTTTKATTTKATTTTTKATTKLTTTSTTKATTKATTTSTAKTTVKVTTTSKTITTRVTTEDESWRYTTELRTSASYPPPTQTTTTKITTTTNPKPYSDEILYENYLFYKKVDEDRNGTYDCIEISDCAALATTVVIPDEIDYLPVKTIGDKAFSDCKNLLSIKIPEGVKSIGASAFEGCSSLESIRLPDGLTTIKSRAFYGCSSLKSIELPKNVVSIESSMFSGCTCLEKITVLNTKCEISSIPENVIVYGYKNSTAHVYCLKNGISFVALEGISITTPVVTTSITTTNTTTTSKSTSKNTTAVTKTTTVQTATTTTKNKIPGDANDDGKTTIADIVEMQKYLCKFKTITKEVFKQLDLNNDGKFNVFDWIILKRQIINAAK